jgi:chromosome segregation protein
MRGILSSAFGHFAELIGRGRLVTTDNVQEVTYLSGVRDRLEKKLAQIEKEESELAASTVGVASLDDLDLKLGLVDTNIANLQREILEYKYKRSERERDIEKKKSELRELVVLADRSQVVSGELALLVSMQTERLSGVQKLLGENYRPISTDLSSLVIDRYMLERNIERLMYKLEDSSVQNADQILQKHAELRSRDEFLIAEIADLERSIENLHSIITELTEKLKTDFDNGVTAINEIFNIYVQKLFGGGSGRVFIVEEVKKSKGEEGTDEEVEVKSGIEVEVDLPKKKVKGLHSLSGGERALVSIALTIAIFHQNHAPFMVLDEADATLDEANAKRYGELLEVIKEKTKLIVVTHNRETMAFADEVYGVTLEKSGASKVLSVSFEDALGYAK